MMDAIELAILAGVSFAAATLLTFRLRAYAVAQGMMDRPNERSSHVVKTPRGGGAAIVIVTLLSLAYIGWSGAAPWRLCAVLGGCGLLVALVGWVDDRRGLPASTRFLAHLAASVAVTYEIGFVRELPLGAATLPLGWVGFVISVLGVAWLINLTNFMDGIDGIAASQAAFVLPASLFLAGTRDGAMSVGLATAAAACGFLVLNWPPAKIFMGDVGSGFLGYMVGVMMLMGARSDPAAGIWPFVILSSTFVVDSTVTLVRRMATGQKWSQPHRSHAYQHGAQRWGHRAVTLAFLGVNLAWVLPIAVLARAYPAAGFGLALFCMLPLIGVALRMRAGLAQTGVER